ncbi:hypothetical protein CDO52_01915 [Nocardiopsis gilva YIM 90087]|uniref:Uncharacterized protein n=1 Tax=Nocardiopsis gilva YIM 90087 TaxID=1235441 RepID=A0A223S0Q0_9ACTN|nr:hypothetical protein [Nocardiopsis gilva]ASU81715.1 hypothetical protein CDO52_01915 [Nocardiopsis gilva YIM 90087]
MTRRVSRAPQTSRPAPARRRVRPSAPRTAVSRARGQQSVAMPEPRETTETIASGSPKLSWVLVTDKNGRTRPEARWA